ncbi:hypothetical protein JAAARDRAFT_42644 [Jaapia argillacea MUCL 33604]|uniref:BTB domain-containing protein n=1 Tax=Jaapia argillacea MUCL 33604 TaxID=933084 RepID=A0A067P4K3_9AGAM|nr:hypothetical protein JAAARDRAFT_42644 [Jaapia argillacea MUCL 33604]
MTLLPEKETFVQIADLWYDDGSVVLQAGSARFRVHRSILSKHSHFLKTTFSLPQVQLPESETYEDCPIVRVTDSEEDWEHYLRAIYEWQYFRPGRKAKFEVVAGVARLSTKYESPHLLQRAIDHLVSTFPSSSAAWNFRKDSRLIPPIPDEFATYLRLALECNIQIILPALYFYACQLPVAETMRALHSVQQSTETDLSTNFVVGRDRLREAETTHTLAFLIWGFRFPGCSQNCNTSQGLAKARSEALKRSTGTETYVQWCITHAGEVGAHHGFCKTCCKTIEEGIQGGREKVWEKLPEFFGLSDWETLRKEALVFDESADLGG